jgi:hypothetical protein
VDGAGAQAFADQNRPRTVTRQIGGVTVAKTYFTYRKGGDGTRTRISERCADPAAVYGDPGDLRTVAITSPSDARATDRIDEGGAGSRSEGAV